MTKRNFSTRFGYSGKIFNLKNLRSFINLVFILLLSQTFFSQEISSEKIQKLVDSYHQNQNFNGVVMVSHRGNVVFRKAYGFANHSFDVPNQIDTRFRIASVTKPITSLAILKLNETGKLNIDDSVSKYLEGFDKRITIRHLLKHRSGLPREATDLSTKHWESFFPHKEILSLAKKADLLFEPGTKSSYSNIGYSVLAAVIKKITGKSYEESIRELVLKPLKMNNTFDEPTARVIENKADGFWSLPDGIYEAGYENKSHVIGAGSLTSTAGDLIKLLDNFEKSRDFSPETKNLFLREKTGGSTLAMSTWEYKTVGENYPAPLKGSIVMHRGACPGFDSIAAKFLDHEISLVILSNQKPLSVINMFNDIGNLMLGFEVKLPADLNFAFYREVIKTGADEYFQKIRKTLQTNEIPDIRGINNMGYNYLGAYQFENMGTDQLNKAIEIFKINTLLNPQEANNYDSLGEGYLAAEQYELALKNYKKSVELDPKNENGKKAIQKIEDILKQKNNK